MVIFTDWFLSPVISRSACGLPMSGEDTGLEAVASPMVGYLGKVQVRAASLDHCPWCHSNGLTYPLRSYRISLEESVTLCTNPQCLFPLVSRPLEDVLASLVLAEPNTGNKRKCPETLVANEPSIPSPKRSRFEEHETQTSASNDNTVDPCNGLPLDVEEHSDSGGSESKKLKVPELNEAVVHKDSDSHTDAFLDTADDVENLTETLQTTDNLEERSFKLSRLNGEDKSLANVALDCKSLPDKDVESLLPAPTDALATIEPMLPVENNSAHSDIEVIQSEPEDMLSMEPTCEENLVFAPDEIFWTNKDKLCWLDSLLVVLVNLQSLRNSKNKPQTEQSPVWTLLAGYDEARATVQSQQQTDKDGLMKVPCHLFHKINTNLENLRMLVFNLLQPKLHCKLGQKETPVFALPLLMKLDSWLESHFESTFYWDFRCSGCKVNTKENVVKTLPTFTNIVPDWHPLRAVHFAPCNNCHRKNQRRRMVLQQIPPVFALHFVEGLPDNNIQAYDFNFKKKHYCVSAVIQYSSELKHFVTWIHRSDGIWLEFDDLKHPRCKSYKTLPVPAQEVHIVFWEEEPRQESRACSPSSTFTESPPTSKNTNHSAADFDNITNDVSQCFPDQSLISAQNDNDFLDGVFEQDSIATAEVDTTIGSTTLLDTFEGLTHNDIITLTLVEIKEDSKKPPSNSTDGETEQAKAIKSLNQIQDSVKNVEITPDSSSTTETKEKYVKHGETVSESENATSEPDNLANDPTFEPKSERRKKTEKTVASKQVKRPKVDAPKRKTAQTTSVQTRSTTAPSKPVSPVSSTVPTPENVPKTAPVTQQEQKGWSNLLERSLGHVQNTSKMTSKQKPISQLKKGCPGLLTPLQQKKVVLPKVVAKPMLRTEDSGGLPLKAAEMYGAFGSKSSKTNLTTVNVNKMTLDLHDQKVMTCNAMVNNSLNTSITKQTTDISSKKTSKMPPGLSETEALRYKILKKLKAKKKKLAKLNEMLGQSGEASFKPDSTNSFSPNSVTSSTLNDEFLSDLLSPATTITSTLSPDSTDFLEMLANGQEVDVGAVMSSNAIIQPPTGAETSNFLDEFMSQAIAERPSEMEEDALSALDLFL